MRSAVIGAPGQPRSSSIARSAQKRSTCTRLTNELADAPAAERWLDEVEPELVINAAAYTAVDPAENERERAFEVNAAGPATLAAWCQRGASLIHVSTDYVFDGAKAGAYLPDDTTGPLGAYGESKLGGEQAMRHTLG